MRKSGVWKPGLASAAAKSRPLTTPVSTWRMVKRPRGVHSQAEGRVGYQPHESHKRDKRKAGGRQAGGRQAGRAAPSRPTSSVAMPVAWPQAMSVSSLDLGVGGEGREAMQRLHLTPHEGGQPAATLWTAGSAQQQPCRPAGEPLASPLPAQCKAGPLKRTIPLPLGTSP